MDAALPTTAPDAPAPPPGHAHPDAADYAERYTRARRENFAVLSWLLPRDLRADFAAVYAFCRWSDDLADEAASPEAALRELAAWREQLDDCFAGRPQHAIFRALQPTIERHDLPAEPLHDLLDAFVQDQHVTRYDTWDQLANYCRKSANPVGRLVLMVGGYRDEERLALSDATCTALQLVNHVQDVRRDVLERGRVYLPAEVAMKHGLSVDQLAACIRDDHTSRTANLENCAACPTGSIGLRALQPAYRAALREMTDQAAALFAQGRQLWPMLDRPLRRPVQLFSLGGEAVLRRIRAMDHDTPVRRPRLGRAKRAELLARVALGWTGSPPSPSTRGGA